MSYYEQHIGPIGDRRQPHRSITGERMFRQRVYLLAEVWSQLDALQRQHGDADVNKTIARLVREEHRRMRADDDSTEDRKSH